MKPMARWILCVGLLSGGCATGESVWSRPSYQPPPPSFRGSQTYSPKTTVSPYQTQQQAVPVDHFGGGQSYGGSSSR